MTMRTRVVAAVFAVAFIGAACDQAATSITNPTSPRLTVGDVISKPSGALSEQYVICKTGPTATFNVTANGSPVSGSPFTVNDGECVVVYQMGGTSVDVQSSENVPAGVQLDQVVLSTLTCGLQLGTSCGGGGPFTTGPTTVFTGPLAGAATSGTYGGWVGGSGPSGNRSVYGVSGVLAEYTNSYIPTGGGEGCTPGYWKNHAGIYSFSKGGQKKPSQWEGYLPTDGFDATFGVTSSFGGTFRLIDALEEGGGDEDALARHAVSALLNAANSGVSYDMTTGEVIALVQAAYASGDFEGAKNTLAAFNEQGCPLDNGI